MKNTELDIANLRTLYAATTEPSNRWISGAPTYDNNYFQVYTSGPGPCRGIIQIGELRRNGDAAFIAAIRNATPELLDIAERCRGNSYSSATDDLSHVNQIELLEEQWASEKARADLLTRRLAVAVEALEQADANSRGNEFRTVIVKILNTN